MQITFLEGDFAIINHGYWEGYATELKLEDVRLCEIFYLMHQFFANTPGTDFELRDYLLRNPLEYNNYKCAGGFSKAGCEVQIFKNGDNSYSVYFRFPCC